MTGVQTCALPISSRLRTHQRQLGCVAHIPATLWLTATPRGGQHALSFMATPTRRLSSAFSSASTGARCMYSLCPATTGMRCVASKRDNNPMNIWLEFLDRTGSEGIGPTVLHEEQWKQYE